MEYMSKMILYPLGDEKTHLVSRDHTYEVLRAVAGQFTTLVDSKKRGGSCGGHGLCF
jgi:hypothetical protein